MSQPQSSLNSVPNTVQDLQSTASTYHQRQQALNELPVSSQSDVNSGKLPETVGLETGKLTANQIQNLMNGRAGHFTLVSNQQISPNHVTMIGYTTPIIKMGGFVKSEQLSQAAPQAMPSLPSSSAVPESSKMSSVSAGLAASSSTMDPSSQYSYSPQTTSAQYRQSVANLNAAVHNSVISQPQQMLSGPGAMSSIRPDKSLALKMEAQSPVASVADPGQNVRMYYSDKLQPITTSQNAQYLPQAKISPYGEFSQLPFSLSFSKNSHFEKNKISQESLENLLSVGNYI